eukprot:Sspe_Gene.26606::Locus_11138_Transcript_1_1_Confidence_1.000_Length_1636::g.26606::m.26606
MWAHPKPSSDASPTMHSAVFCAMGGAALQPIGSLVHLLHGSFGSRSTKYLWRPGWRGIWWKIPLKSALAATLFSPSRMPFVISPGPARHILGGSPVASLSGRASMMILPSSGLLGFWMTNAVSTHAASSSRRFLAHTPFASHFSQMSPLTFEHFPGIGNSPCTRTAPGSVAQLSVSSAPGTLSASFSTSVMSIVFSGRSMFSPWVVLLVVAFTAPLRNVLAGSTSSGSVHLRSPHRALNAHAVASMAAPARHPRSRSCCTASCTASGFATFSRFFRGILPPIRRSPLATCALPVVFHLPLQPQPSRDLLEVLRCRPWGHPVLHLPPHVPPDGRGQLLVPLSTPKALELVVQPHVPFHRAPRSPHSPPSCSQTWSSTPLTRSS